MDLGRIVNNCFVILCDGTEYARVLCSQHMFVSFKSVDLHLKLFPIDAGTSRSEFN